eukprot:ctg_865.g290
MAPGECGKSPLIGKGISRRWIPQEDPVPPLPMREVHLANRPSLGECTCRLRHAAKATEARALRLSIRDRRGGAVEGATEGARVRSNKRSDGEGTSTRTHGVSRAVTPATCVERRGATAPVGCRTWANGFGAGNWGAAAVGDSLGAPPAAVAPPTDSPPTPSTRHAASALLNLHPDQNRPPAALAQPPNLHLDMTNAVLSGGGDGGSGLSARGTLLDFELPDDEFLRLLETKVGTVYSARTEAERKAAQAELTALQTHPQAWMRADKILDADTTAAGGDARGDQTLHSEQGDRIVIVGCDARVAARVRLQTQPHSGARGGARVAGAMAHLHERHRQRQQDVTDALREQPQHFATAQRGGVRFLGRRDDPGQDRRVEDLVQPGLSGSVRAVPVRVRPAAGAATAPTVAAGDHCAHAGKVSVVDSAGLHLRDRPVGDADRDVRLLGAAAQRVMRCLVEIGALSVSAEYDARFFYLYAAFMGKLAQVVPIEVDIAAQHDRADEATQAFVMDLALFFNGFFATHARLLEQSTDAAQRQALVAGNLYLVKIARVNDVEVFKTCLEWWRTLAEDLYQSLCSVLDYAVGERTPLAVDVDRPSVLSLDEQQARRQLYANVLYQIALVMIQRMAKPEEVLIVEDENGELVRETTKDTDALATYKTMRETLIYLTHIDPLDIENIMIEKLDRQLDGTEWSWQNLNTLCWAIDQGPAEAVRGEARQGQQGGGGRQHHVRGWAVSAVSAGALALFEDGGEQAVRVYARAASGRAGHGLRHVSEDRAKVPPAVCAGAPRRARVVRAGDARVAGGDGARPGAASGALVLRVGRYDDQRRVGRGAARGVAAASVRDAQHALAGDAGHAVHRHVGIVSALLADDLGGGAGRRRHCHQERRRAQHARGEEGGAAGDRGVLRDGVARCGGAGARRRTPGGAAHRAAAGRLRASGGGRARRRGAVAVRGDGGAAAWLSAGAVGADPHRVPFQLQRHPGDDQEQLRGLPGPPHPSVPAIAGDECVVLFVLVRAGAGAGRGGAVFPAGDQRGGVGTETHRAQRGRDRTADHVGAAAQRGRERALGLLLSALLFADSERHPGGAHRHAAQAGLCVARRDPHAPVSRRQKRPGAVGGAEARGRYQRARRGVCAPTPDRAVARRLSQHGHRRRAPGGRGHVRARRGRTRLQAAPA